MAKKSMKGMNAAPSMVTDKPSAPRNQRRTIETRKIKNGYVVRQSGHLSDPYEEEETYHPTKPKIAVNVGGKVARANRLKDVPL